MEINKRGLKSKAAGPTLRGALGHFARACLVYGAVAIIQVSGFAEGATPEPMVSPAPAEPSSEVKALVGQYGSAESLLVIYELDGQLFADGMDFQRAPLRRLASTQYSVEASKPPHNPIPVRFQVDSENQVDAVIVGDSRLTSRDIGREVMDTIRAGVRTDAARLRAAALEQAPPAERPPKRKTDLVALADVDSSIKFDIRYATTNNFMGIAIYEQPGAYMQRDAALALHRVEKRLAPMGYGLLIHDAYRPWFVTKMFWDATPPESHIFVADPSQGSRHNRGCAVDLTLYDRATGKAVEMPSRYDEMSTRAYADYIGGTGRQRWLRNLLRKAMEEQGFVVYPQEWWHFDYKDWHDYAIGNVSFKQLEAAKNSKTETS
jgi:D-alanyl-D-alanine dipeptidase